jgi:Ca-activated chloride channel family protein
VRFAQPHALAALALAPLLGLLILWSVRRRRRDLRRFAGEELVPRIAAAARLERQAFKGILAVAGFACVALALARPQWGARLEPIGSAGVDVVIALDASDSMLAEDLRPSRLERAKAAAGDLIERLSLDRVGVVAFAGTAEVLCPLTPDHEGARLFIDSIDPLHQAVPGTALGEALRASLSVFSRRERKHKAIVLVTDGESHEPGAEEAAAAAAAEGAVVYALGVGSGRGEPVPVRGTEGELRGYKKDADGRVITSRLDEEALAALARAGRGRYLRLSGGQEEIAALAAEIGSLERKERQAGLRSRLEDRYQIPLAAAALLLALEAALPERRAGRRAQRRGALAAALALGLIAPPALAASPRRLNEEGNRAYRKAELERALQAYTEAQVGAPQSPEIQYNLGNVFYRQQEYQRAGEAYRKALESARGALARDAAYNLGNARFQEEDYAGAAAAYRGALKIDPADREAKRNLELALAHLKPPPPGGGGKDKKDEDKKEPQEPPPAAGQEPQPQRQDRKNAPSPGEIAKEEAERLLDALAQEERDNLERERRRHRAPQTPPGGKDW